jgi:hypothetical protein
MNTPIPTPFDIINPGPGAIVPTSLAWILLTASTLSVLLYINYRRRTPSANSIQATLNALLDELRIAAAQPINQQSLERTTRLVRRIITPYLSEDIATMSCSELKSLAASLHCNMEDQGTSLSTLLIQLAEIEEQAYAPQTNETGSAKIRELHSELIGGLESHVRRFRPL